MSALEDLDFRTCRTNACAGHLAALQSAHPEGPPEEEPEEPMSDGDVLAAVKRARRFVEQAERGGALS